jgi:hypothetical protein
MMYAASDGARSAGDDSAEKLVAEIGNLLAERSRTSLSNAAEMGSKLQRLKAAVGLHQWGAVLEQLGVNVFGAIRMMVFADSPLGEAIRSGRTDWAEKLSTNLQKLALFGRLSPEQLAAAMEQMDTRKLTMRQIAARVRAMVYAEFDSDDEDENDPSQDEFDGTEDPVPENGEWVLEQWEDDDAERRTDNLDAHNEFEKDDE